MILNNRQVGNVVTKNLHHQINKQVCADFRTSDDAEILSMQGGEYRLTKAIDLSDGVGELTVTLADRR